MAIVVGEMAVEPRVEPERRAATAPEQEAQGPLAGQLCDRIEERMRVQVARRERLRAD